MMQRAMITILIAMALLTSGITIGPFNVVSAAHAEADGGDF
jgi:hypothetical protein